MKKAIFEAPNGKFYFKAYNERGDAVFTSELEFDTYDQAKDASEKVKVLEKDSKEAKALEAKIADSKKAQPKKVAKKKSAK